MIVHVRHPAPVRAVGVGAQVETAFDFSMTTPVRLREVSAPEMDEVASVGTGRFRRPLHAFEGRLWHAVRYDDPAAPLAAREVVGARAFVEYLESDRVDLPRPSEMEWQFKGTPLRGFRSLPGSRAGGYGMAHVRTIVEDGRERSSVDVARFLENEVVLADGQLFVRTTGPHANLRIDDPAYDDAVQVAAGRPTTAQACRLDRVQRFLETHHARELERMRRAMGRQLSRRDRELLDRTVDPDHMFNTFAHLTSPDVGAFPWHLAGDDDLRHQVGGLAYLARDWGGTSIRRFGREAKRAGVLPERLDRVNHFLALGRVGAVRDDEVEEGLLAVRAYLAALHEAHPETLRSPKLKALVRHLDAYALPLWRDILDQRARLERPEDEDAWAGLGPGMV